MERLQKTSVIKRRNWKWALRKNAVGLSWGWRTFQYEEQHEWGPRGRKLWAIYEVQEVL